MSRKVECRFGNTSRRSSGLHLFGSIARKRDALLAQAGGREVSDRAPTTGSYWS